MSLFLSAPLGEAPKGTLSIALLPVFQVNGKAVADDAARASMLAAYETRLRGIEGEAPLTFHPLAHFEGMTLRPEFNP